MATTNDTAPDTKSEDNGGPGKPAEALTALVTGMTKAPPTAAADAKFCRAIATGWHAREALKAADGVGQGDPWEKPERHPGHVFTAIQRAADDFERAFVEHEVSHDMAPAPSPPDVPRFVENGDVLKRISELDPNDWLLVVSAQLTADLAALKAPLEDAGQDTKVVGDAITALTNGQIDRSFAARELSSRMAETLYAADYRLGKAYSLGWGLGSLAVACSADPKSPPSCPGAFVAFLRDETRYSAIDDRLSELASLLPAHAGHAVQRSLALWQKAANDPQVKTKISDDVGKRQVQKWRTLVTGEKAAKDELTATNLVSVAATTTRNLASAAGQGIGKAWRGFVVLGVTALVLLAVGVALLVSTDTAGDIAGLSAVIGSAGLTWKGLGSTVGAALAKFEQPAWDSAVDEVIGVAISPGLPVGRSGWRDRFRSAAQRAEPVRKPNSQS